MSLVVGLGRIQVMQDDNEVGDAVDATCEFVPVFSLGDVNEQATDRHISGRIWITTLPILCIVDG